MFKRALVAGLALTVLASGLSCRESATEVAPPVAILLTPPTDSLAVGESLQLTARVISTTGMYLPDAPVAWTSSDPTVATVSSAGLVTGVRVGTIVVTVQSGSATVSREIRVLPEVRGVAIEAAALLLDLYDEPVLVVAHALDQGGEVIEGRIVTWRTLDPDVATVIDGRITPQSLGIARIVATTGAHGDTLTVQVGVVSIASVTVSPGSARLVEGGGGLLDAHLARATGERLNGRTATWTSHDPSIAIVDASGFVTGVSVGTTTIEATSDNGLRGSATLTIVPLDGVPRVAAGFSHSCAIPLSGRLYCWGTNVYGQLGIVLPSDCGLDDFYYYYYYKYPCSPLPLEVQPSERFHAVAAGRLHTCALRIDGTALCWGEGGGRLGNDDIARAPGPVQVTSSARFITLTAGDAHTCGLTEQGSAYCWGWNGHGQLGTGDLVDRLVPTPVASGHVWVGITAGDRHTCGIRADRSLMCWGSNVFNQIDANLTTDALLPVVVPGLQVRQIAGGISHACAVTTTQELVCWGIGTGNGEVGNGTVIGNVAPVAVAGAPAWRDVWSRDRSSCGRADDDTVLCWGLNWDGILGNGSFGGTQLAPGEALGGERLQQVALGWHHACGMMVSGAISCWGTGYSGEIGLMESLQRSTPVVIIP